MVEAVQLLARTEGIFLDPVYSGKAMAGLIDLIRTGVFTKDQTILFLHTGGSTGLFGYTEALSAGLREHIRRLLLRRRATSALQELVRKLTRLAC